MMKKKKVFIILPVILIGLFILIYKERKIAHDIIVNVITSDNTREGLFDVKSMEWCDLPIGFDLDKGGVPNGYQDITHPSVILASTNDSMAVWMAATPYPTSLSTSGEPYENTCIFYSTVNDAKYPTSFSPIFKNPIIYKGTAKYNSDPDIFYNNADTSLYVITRKRRGPEYITKIVLQKSKDGNQWSEPNDLFTTDSLCLCPCLLKGNNDTYQIYAFNTRDDSQKTTNNIQIWESRSLSQPSFELKHVVSWRNKQNVWHGDIVYHNETYYMVFCGTSADYRFKWTRKADSTKYLWFARSKDGLNFDVNPRPILKCNGAYRSSFFIDPNDNIIIYCSFHNRFRGDQSMYPAGNRIGKIEVPLSSVANF